MLRSAVSKVMWVGRATAFLVGLAVIVGVTVGLSSAVLAQANRPGGQPFFRLGEINTVNAISSLVGSVAADAMLLIDNNGGGPALDLQVEPGQAPMKVDSSGKVANLNADQLDGKSETDFYAAGSKVADSAHADDADNAINAANAANAANANHATSADSATNAQNAQNAANADTLDGKDSLDFAAAYKRTVVVSPVGTDTQNGQALLDALSGITDASATKPYLLYIEAGTYDLGSRSLAMKQHVGIEGAGELKTLITSSVTTGSGCLVGTVVGANDVELRFLTVRNTTTGFSSCGAGIFIFSASPRLTHVTANSTGGESNTGVVNVETSRATMTSVTATASGGTFNVGVSNGNSSATIKQSRLSGTTQSLRVSGRFPPGPTKVALTQLEGVVLNSANPGALQCFNNYDQNLNPVTCP